MLRLAFRGIRGRKGPFAGAFIALAVAAALVAACGTLLQAGLGATAPVERYAGAPVVVAGHQSAEVELGSQETESVALIERARVDRGLAGRLAALPGVRSAVVDASAPARVFGPRGVIDGPTGHPVWAHPWGTAQLTPYVLRGGRAPQRADEVVVDAGMAGRGHLRIGQRVRLAATGPARAMTVVGVAGTRAVVLRQGAVFVTAAEALRLGGHPARADAIGVLLDRGADRDAVARRVRAAAGPDADVLTGADRGKPEHLEVADGREAVIAIGGTFGGLALLIAMFVVASTLGLSVAQREREVALLRAVGATPRQVRRMIAWESVLIGLVAAAVGVLPGAELARLLGTALSDRAIAPEDLAVPFGLVPALTAAAATVVTALAAVKAAGRRAARIDPTRALQDAAVQPRAVGFIRLVAGLIALGGAAALLSVSVTSTNAQTSAGTAGGMALVLVVAAACLGPVVARVAAWIPGALVARGSRVGGFLAVSNVRTSPRRFSSAMTPLVLTVAMSSTLMFMTTTREHAAAVQGHQRVIAELSLSSDGPGLPQSVVAEARATRGVAAAAGIAAMQLGPSLHAKVDPLFAQVADPAGLERVLDLDVRSGALADMRDDTVALSAQRAEAAHAKVGDRVAVTLGDGAHTHARVVAIYDRELGFGQVVVPTAMAAGHRTTPLVDHVLVRTASGADPHRVAARLRRLAARYPGLHVGDRAALASQEQTVQASNRWLARILAAVIFVFTAIAVINTLMMIALSRTRELALLRLVGGTKRQVRAMARWEAALVVGVGVGLGGLIALVTLVPFSRATTGTSMPYAPPGQVALVLGGAALLGVVGSQIPTRLAMRSRAVDAIGVRD